MLPKGWYLKVNHFHQGNSSNKKRHGKPYMTVAIIKDSTETVIGAGKACCSKYDLPVRRVGRAIAVGRAIRDAALTSIIDEAFDKRK